MLLLVSTFVEMFVYYNIKLLGIPQVPEDVVGNNQDKAARNHKNSFYASFPKQAFNNLFKAFELILKSNNCIF